MMRRLTTALTRLADSELRLSVLGTFKYGGEAALVLAPIGMAIFQWSSLAAKTWAVWGFGGCGLVVPLGWLAMKGAAWLETKSRKNVSLEHSSDLSASLRALRRVLTEEDAAEKMHAPLLACIASAVNRVCPREGGEVFACLLMKDGSRLKLVAYSRYRDGRVPSADIDLAEPEGGARACREMTITYVPDTRECASSAAFAGKSYRCILAFPLVDGGACGGVVVVDSTRAHHLDDHLQDIDAHVRPFIEMMQLNLAASRTTRKRVRGVR